MSSLEPETRPPWERPSPADVRAQLNRILDSPDFQAAERRRAFLRHVVEETLAGRSNRLKGTTIAIAVFGRDADFDPQTDPIVRLEAHRLRRDLDGYYATAGRDDPVRIGIPKGGYAIVCEWQSPPIPERGPTPGAETAAAQPLAPARQSAWGPARRLVLAVCAVLIVGVIGVAAWQMQDRDDAVRPTSAQKGPSIAVLPYRNLSGDPAKRYISDGLSEQLITELAQYRDLIVLSIGATAVSEDGSFDLQSIRSGLGADFVVAGGVRVFEDQLRISSRLIDARDGRHLWAGSYADVFTPKTVFQIQETMAREIGGALAGKYGLLAQSAMAQTENKPPESLDAYDCVLRYYAFMRNIDPARHAEIRGCLERAVTLDPDYAEAWAVLANVYHQEKRFGYDSGGEQGDPSVRALEAAKRAIALDSDNPTGHLVSALIYFADGNIARFKEAGDRAISLNPGSADFLAQYGSRLAFHGEWDRGLAMVDQAIALNPAHPAWYLFPRALFHFDRGEFEGALAQVERIDMPGFFWSYLLRAAILGQLGRNEEAMAAVDRVLALKPRFREEAWSLFGVWNFPQPVLLHLVAGLGKAGLKIPPPPEPKLGAMRR
ncbi:MAG: tetratricopeptide repeat protein [Rhodospirillales bacterium]|nr:tetratricopeptide repeat protein [Rhodospirillales bacterium]